LSGFVKAFSSMQQGCTYALQVMRELSDKVVEWQDMHGAVERDLITANMRIAELQTEHDKLVGVVKSLMASQQQQRLVDESVRSNGSRNNAPGTAKAAKRVGFLGRLKTPRN
jgi:hypothetical protein